MVYYLWLYSNSATSFTVYKLSVFLFSLCSFLASYSIRLFSSVYILSVYGASLQKQIAENTLTVIEWLLICVCVFGGEGKKGGVIKKELGRDDIKMGLGRGNIKKGLGRDKQ